MQTTRQHRTTDPVTTALADVAAATDRLVAAVSTADPRQVRMATAGSLLASTDRLTATVIAVLSTVTHRGVIADEGVSVGAWLRTFAARTTGDEKMLAACVGRLADMPTIRDWFHSGQLSWPAVRGIVLAVRNLTREQRRWVDSTLAGDHRRVGRLDADQVIAAVETLANRARPDLHRDRERRGARDEYLWMQEGLDRWTVGHFQLNPESSDKVRRALTTPPDTDADDDHGHDGLEGRERGDSDRPEHEPDRDDGHDVDRDPAEPVAATDTSDGADREVAVNGYDVWRRRRTWSNARAFVALCEQRPGLPGGGAPPAARPSLLLLADITTLLGDGVGSGVAQLLTLSTRGPVELTPAGVRRLACDATWRMILTDGDHILGATAAHPKVSATMRAALIARDGACRFPACRQPADLCENHHVVPVSEGGPTTLDNLALLCHAHHHAVHDSQWANILHPDGTMTFTRRGIAITSVPRVHQRLRPTTPPPPGRPTRRRADPRRPDDRDPTAADPDPPPVDLPF